MTKKVMVSGGFDPLHKGHVRYIKYASMLGKVTVALNSDAWLKRKKGYIYMAWADRAEILMALKYVHKVVPVDDDDGSVCKALYEHKPDFFVNGGDRFKHNVPEGAVCRELKIVQMFNAGGEKIESSSEIVKRSWGTYQVLYHDEYKVKILTVLPGKRTSLQRHKARNEHWIYVKDNAYRYVPIGEVHQLTNPTKEPMVVVEIQTGTYFGEDDIERL